MGGVLRCRGGGGEGPPEVLGARPTSGGTRSNFPPNAKGGAQKWGRVPQPSSKANGFLESFRTILRNHFFPPKTFFETRLIFSHALSLTPSSSLRILSSRVLPTSGETNHRTTSLSSDIPQQHLKSMHLHVC